MPTRWPLAAWMILAAVAAATAQSQDTAPVQRLALLGGEVVEVAAARIEGDLVFVTFPGGLMQAYPTEDVDLAASGLLPSEVEVAQPTRVAPPSLAATGGRREGVASVFTITDADVAHVARPDSQGTDSATGSGPRAVDDTTSSSPLTVTGLLTEARGSKLILSGSVHNGGTRPVTSVGLVALAMDDQGRVQGSGSATLPHVLAPGASIGFSMDLEVGGPVSDIKVRASARTARPSLPGAPGRPQTVTESAQESGE